MFRDTLNQLCSDTKIFPLIIYSLLRIACSHCTLLGTKITKELTCGSEHAHIYFHPFYFFRFYVSVNSFWQCLCNTMNCRQEIRPIHLCWYKLKIFYKVPTFPSWGNGFHCGKKKILWGERSAAKENIGHFNDLQKHKKPPRLLRFHIFPPASKGAGVGGLIWAVIWGSLKKQSEAWPFLEYSVSSGWSIGEGTEVGEGWKKE